MAANMCMQNCTDARGFLYEEIAREIWLPWDDAFDNFVYSPWLFSLLGSTMVGLAGIFPLLIIPIDEGADLKNGASAGTLKILLSFAVGGLLGDVFLHLLPEAWENEFRKTEEDAGHPPIPCGLWVLSGFLVFVILEKLFSIESEPEVEKTEEHALGEKEMENNNSISLIGNNLKNGFTSHCQKAEYSKNLSKIDLQHAKPVKNGYTEVANGYKIPGKNGFLKTAQSPNGYANGALGASILPIDETKDCLKRLARTNGYTVELPSSPHHCPKSENRKARDGRQVAKVVKSKSRNITGYLNLMANIIDNFTHGLAVGGSFLISFRLGALTTFAILVHEIPHEVGDFAILLRSGFSRWDAARAQIFTASGGIFGALAAVFFSSGGVEAGTNWILPFTAGGFLHIGMVTILPDLLKESNPKESLKQLGALLFGITLMAILTVLCD